MLDVVEMNTIQSVHCISPKKKKKYKYSNQIDV